MKMFRFNLTIIKITQINKISRFFKLILKISLLSSTYLLRNKLYYYKIDMNM